MGLEVPIQPSRVRVGIFERPYGLASHLTLIDGSLGFYARPTAERGTLIGSRTSLERLDDPNASTPDPDPGFVRDVAARLAHRIPALDGAPYRCGRSGILDMTPDERPLLGPAGPPGLFLATGWSGTGFKKAPAVGAELAAWIHSGTPRRPDLAGYSPERFSSTAAKRR